MTHHPTLYRTRRRGCWAACCCGWQSRRWTNTTGAHLDFGRHLTKTATTDGASGD